VFLSQTAESNNNTHHESNASQLMLPSHSLSMAQCRCSHSLPLLPRCRFMLV
jgi:hypothetical protein